MNKQTKPTIEVSFGANMKTVGILNLDRGKAGTDIASAVDGVTGKPSAERRSLGVILCCLLKFQKRVEFVRNVGRRPREALQDNTF